MKKGYFSVGTAALLSLGLFTSQALAQDFCNASHSGTSTKQSLSFAHEADGNKDGDIGDYHYEVWTKSGNAEATFYSDGSFSCSFSKIDDYLCREGVFYGSNSGKDPLSVGHLVADFSMSSFVNSGGVSYAYVGVYGWMQNPLIEWYIVDNWGPASRPNWLGTSRGTITVDGAEYEIFTNSANRATIEGNKAFDQIYSLRSSERKCGTIDITAHFQAWKEKGLTLGSSLYEAKVLGEAGQYPEFKDGGPGASGTIDFNYAKVYVGDGTTPTSSTSTNSSSSVAQNLPAVGTLPGTIEVENYQNSDGKFENNGTTLGTINAKAWVEYTVNITYDGTYDFSVLAAREDKENSAGSNLSISIDGEKVGTISGILTTSWTDFQKFSGTTKKLTKGQHTLRVTFDYGWIDIDNISFTEKDVDKSSKYEPPSSSSTAPGSSASVVPGSSGSASPTSNGSTITNSGSSQKGDSSVDGGSMAIANIHLSMSERNMQVFDIQGKFLGSVTLSTGVSLNDAVKAKFQNPGIYIVRHNGLVKKIAVR